MRRRVLTILISSLWRALCRLFPEQSIAVNLAGSRRPFPRPEPLRRDLLRYLGGTSEERARLIGALTWRNPAMADLLADLEADDVLRARFVIQLMRSPGGRTDQRPPR